MTTTLVVVERLMNGALVGGFAAVALWVFVIYRETR